MGDVVVFTNGLYEYTILNICPFLTFIFIQHHLPSPALYIPDSDTQPAIVSKDIIPVPRSYDISLSSCTLCVASAWRSVSNMKNMPIDSYGVLGTIVSYILFLIIG